MTRRTDYTNDEWALLTTTPRLIGLRMLAVSRSGPIGKLRELVALSACLTLQTVPARFRRNELVLALLEESDYAVSAAFRWSGMSGVAGTIAAARLRALPSCENVAALLMDKTPWAEADGLKRWMLWLATSVAKASSDGWLGFGRRVSAEEAALLRQIATSLRLTVSDTALFTARLDLARATLQGSNEVPGERTP
ncbi:MAG TPA: hypothetical protein VFS83_10510 [Ktedonobacterales bacterium]|nr:hypothetical protein [Ktedonobacterales bacterium]